LPGSSTAIATDGTGDAVARIAIGSGCNYAFGYFNAYEAIALDSDGAFSIDPSQQNAP